MGYHHNVIRREQTQKALEEALAKFQLEATPSP